MISPTYDFSEIAFVRKTGASFLKILLQSHSGLHSAPSSVGGATGSVMTLILRNLGDKSANFKIQACRRKQPQEDQAGDTDYADMVGYTNVVVASGGLLTISVNTLGNNLFSLIALGANKTKLLIDCKTNSVGQAIVWKKDDELDRAEDQDSYINDETPKEFQVGGGSWPWGGQGAGGMS